uniref:SS18 N-terminal domain-containing protein n=1 Tax=Kalanchoe fedtschenkoi TaxID=63787 RepID=A0A7N0U4X5_KALFE
MRRIELLDENKQLIIMILENQSQGKLAECAQYQAVLQKNLMYLAAIADAQPQAQQQAVLSQTPVQPALQQGHFMPQPQPIMTQQQPHMLTPNMPLQFHNQMQFIQPQQQQLFPGHLGIRPGIQNQMLQMSPGGFDPSNFSNALGSRHNDVQGKQFGGDKQS